MAWGWEKARLFSKGLRIGMGGKTLFDNSPKTGKGQKKRGAVLLGYFFGFLAGGWDGDFSQRGGAEGLFFPGKNPGSAGFAAGVKGL